MDAIKLDLVAVLISLSVLTYKQRTSILILSNRQIGF